MKFDLLIRGGRVVDPATRTVAKADIGIIRGRIARVATELPADAGARVIDAANRIVTPGLVDLHTHVFHGATYWGVRPDPIAARTGVTTWVDAGSPGAMALENFRESVVRTAAVRIFTLMNVSYIGLVAPDHELSNLNYLDKDIFQRVCDGNRDIVVGVKVRMGASTVGESGLEALKRARATADAVELPLMMHIATGPPSLDECVPYLGCGDILTHCFTGCDMRIVEGSGQCRRSVEEALERGIILDVGHGTGGFSFDVAEAALAQGRQPDVISTDIHQMSVRGPMFDLPTCMSKFLALGMSLEDVVRAATLRPAEVLGLPDGIGSLSPGAVADVAIFQLMSGNFTFYDVNMEARRGSVLLKNELTVVGGRPLARATLEPPAAWVSSQSVWPDSHNRLVRKQWAGYGVKTAAN